MTRRVSLLLLLAGLAAGAWWLGRVRARAVGRQHGTPDHWPPVARKPAA